MTIVLSRHPARRSRADWYAEVKRLKGQGMSGVAIATRLGISHSFVYALLNDPDGTRDRKRKLGYAGACIDCGSPTDGSNGTNTPERCFECAHDYQRVVLKYWTRERVVDAIQRWAREHGTPPLADEWIKSDPERGYPTRTSVYRGTHRSSSPFDSWADAIEAAGFPRPRVGDYERVGEIGLPEPSLYALRRARERGERGITARLLADERGVIRQTAWATLNALVRRGLLYRDGTVGGGRGNGHPAILYKAVSPTTETD